MCFVKENWLLWLFVCLFVCSPGFCGVFFLEDTVLPPYTTSVLIHLWPVQHSLFMCFYRNADIYLAFSLDLATHMLMLIFALSSLTPSTQSLPDVALLGSPQQTYLHVLFGVTFYIYIFFGFPLASDLFLTQLWIYPSTAPFGAAFWCDLTGDRTLDVIRAEYSTDISFFPMVACGTAVKNPTQPKKHFSP